MIVDYLQILLAIALLWGRGYMLIYLIDRTKSFSFGFKFFAGWLLALGGFTIEVFGSHVFTGAPLIWPLWYGTALSQIFGFGVMVYLAEGKVPWPDPRKFVPFLKKQLASFAKWKVIEKAALVTFLVLFSIRVCMALWTVTNIPTYEFDAWNNWNLKAKVIHTEQEIPIDPESPVYLGGGIISYPLQDAIFKAWLTFVAGEYKEQYVNLVPVIYYVLLIALFYFSLPRKMNRLIRIGATYALSSLPLLMVHSHVAYVDVLFSIYLYVAVISMFYFLAGSGTSFYYLSGMGVAFSVWTKNEGLSIILPVFVVVTLGVLIRRRVSITNFILSWVFVSLTFAWWMAFRIARRLDIFSGDSSTVDLLFNSHFLSEMASSIFLRSHFNILWIAVVAVIIFRFRDIIKYRALSYLMTMLVVLFVLYNGVILFTDKALDLSALARINLQLAPIAVAFLAFFFQRFFVTIKSDE